jgi:hypothetical protein
MHLIATLLSGGIFVQERPSTAGKADVMEERKALRSNIGPGLYDLAVLEAL